MSASTHMRPTWWTIPWDIIALGATLGNVCSNGFRTKAIEHIGNKFRMEAVNGNTLESNRQNLESAVKQQKATYEDSVGAQLSMPSDGLPQLSQALEQATLQQPVQQDVRQDVEVIVEGEVFKESSAAMILSSPVFSTMLRNSVPEGTIQTINLKQKSKEEYTTFRRFLHPWGVHLERVTIENVDVMIPWFHEFQMREKLDECQALLLTQEANVMRLHQAAKYDLTAQYERCLEEVAAQFLHMRVADQPRDMESMRTLLCAMRKVIESNAKEIRKFKKKVKQEAQSSKLTSLQSPRARTVVYHSPRPSLQDPASDKMVTDMMAKLNI